MRMVPFILEQVELDLLGVARGRDSVLTSLGAVVELGIGIIFQPFSI
jgi:hypothetical protein